MQLSGKDILTNMAEVLPGYRFLVFINNNVMGFQSISGISYEIETKTYQEGGLNYMVHTFPGAVTQQRSLQLEKGCYMGMNHPFYLVGESIGQLSLMVLNRFSLPGKFYDFTGITVKKWEAGTFHAENNALLVDKFEIAYEDFDVR